MAQLFQCIILYPRFSHRSAGASDAAEISCYYHGRWISFLKTQFYCCSNDMLYFGVLISHIFILKFETFLSEYHIHLACITMMNYKILIAPMVPMVFPSSESSGKNCWVTWQLGWIFTLFSILLGVWTCWSDFTLCSATCGDGVRYRTRHCVSTVEGTTFNIPCSGESQAQMLCTGEPCAGKT